MNFQGEERKGERDEKEKKGRKEKKGQKEKGKTKEEREGEKRRKKKRKKKKKKQTYGRGPQVVLFVAPPEGATTLQSNQNLKSPTAQYRGDLNDFGCSQSLPEGGAKIQKI